MLKSKRAFETEELSIRFVNTVAWRLREPSEERLKSPTALFEWLGQNDVAAPEVLHRLTRAEKTRSRDVPRVYEDAIQLRETIYALFVSRIRGQPPPAGALNLFSEFLWRGPSGLRLEWEKGRLTWRTRRVHDRALDLLRPIALSAADRRYRAPAADVLKRSSPGRRKGKRGTHRSRASHATVDR